MFFLVVILAMIGLLLVVAGVLDLRARRRGARYTFDGRGEVDASLETDVTRVRSRFQNGGGQGPGS